VDVVDPAHPLFGRRFRVTLLPYRTPAPQCVFVEFTAGLQIRIPLSATNLRYSPPPGAPLKVSWQSIQELLALSQEWEPPCPSTSHRSGTRCPKRNDKKSSKK
jgi:hypothetical protein